MQVSRYKQLFLTEARVKLAQLEDGVILLEKKTTNPAVIDRLLQQLHALKGDAATMDYQAFANSVHQLEDFFLRIKRGEMPLTLEKVDACFLAIDALRRDLEQIQSDDTELDLGPAFAFTLRTAPRSQSPRRAKKKAESPNKEERSTVLYAPLNSYVEVGVPDLEKTLGLANAIVSAQQQLQRILQTNSLGALKVGLYNLSTQASDLRKQIVDMKLIPVRQYFAFLSRLVRDLARQQKKIISFDFKDNAMRFEAHILESLREACVQLIKNAVDHGFREGEKGTIQLAFDLRSDHMQVVVKDSGHGFDWDALANAVIRNKIATKQRLSRMKPEERKTFLSSAGVSSRSVATLISGRGIGLPSVRSTVDSLHGSFTIATARSGTKSGTVCEIVVPLQPTLFRALTWQWGSYRLALPLFVVEKIIQVSFDTASVREYVYRGARIPTCTTSLFVDDGRVNAEHAVAVAIVRSNGERRALLLPAGIREQELIAQSVPVMKNYSRVASVAVSEDALPVTIVNHRIMFKKKV